MKNNKILVLTILAIVFTIIGSTLAFWSWNTSEAQKTLIGFTVEPNLSCTGDGGGNIISSEKKLVPTSCTNETYAIQRTITLNTSSAISTNDLFLDLWLDVIDIDEGLTNSENFKYAITKNPNDCTTNAVTGSFNGVIDGERVNLLKNKEYIGTNQDTYYLYIWLDEEEKNTNTINQSFELKLGGSCQDDKSTYKANFADNTWQQVAEACQSGEVPDTWNVGDTKTMLIGENEVEIIIIGKNHDEYADGSGIAPMTFMTKQVLKQRLLKGDPNADVGWDDSLMYSYLHTDVLESMEAKANIKEVKKVSKSATGTQTSNDKLFLLSRKETESYYTWGSEGTFYEYFTSSAYRALKDLSGADSGWWLRTMDSDDPDKFAYVDNDGYTVYRAAYTLGGVVFAFCF